ncbi:SDR family oxidoreductase [Streptomyces sp. NA04227]|uniref:SDR family oxidoreductase n=1 Tax=Streptomyces sp. NA04227 TaxID=2742136 RepID=UPI0015925209|nr:SDR family oxidoreductase [Streptomyces sp. NA04227]QKW05149.1 SDR family oxidoreductase [Streptomyces sp. NA04227]
MTSPILVTGGTGKLGRHVVPLLREAGHDVRVLSRRSKDPLDGVEYVSVDLLDGDGLAGALDGVTTVLHLAGANKGDDKATANLVEAARRTGEVEHLVHVSVIAADKLPIGWFRSKYAAEQAVIGSGIPWTVLRPAQFHDIVWDMVTAMAKMPVFPAPGGLRFQPVDIREVAERLVGLALDKPAGLVPDLAGPKVYHLSELGRGYLQARGKRRLMLPVRMPGKVGRAYRAGENLNLDAAVVGGRTWEEFLAERVER